jgi:hypothetical protein
MENEGDRYQREMMREGVEAERTATTQKGAVTSGFFLKRAIHTHKKPGKPPEGKNHEGGGNGDAITGEYSLPAPLPGTDQFQARLNKANYSAPTRS